MKVSDLKLGQLFVAKTKFCEVVKITTLDDSKLFTEFAFTVLSDNHQLTEEEDGQVLFPIHSFLEYYKPV